MEKIKNKIQKNNRQKIKSHEFITIFNMRFFSILCCMN